MEAPNKTDAEDKLIAEFTQGYNSAHALYNESKIAECIAALRELIAKPRIPRYHRMKILVLLAVTVSSWDEAIDFYLTAEVLWGIVDRSNIEGAEDFVCAQRMADLRRALDDVKIALKEEEKQQEGSQGPELDLDWSVEHSLDMQELVQSHLEENPDFLDDYNGDDVAGPQGGMQDEGQSGMLDGELMRKLNIRESAENPVSTIQAPSKWNLPVSQPSAQHPAMRSALTGRVLPAYRAPRKRASY